MRQLASICAELWWQSLGLSLPVRPPACLASRHPPCLAKSPCHARSHPCLPPSLPTHPPPDLANFQADAAKQEGLKQAIVASLNLDDSFTPANVQLNVISVTQREIGPGRKLQVRVRGEGWPVDERRMG